jgi:hypothetical protein
MLQACELTFSPMPLPQVLLIQNRIYFWWTTASAVTTFFGSEAIMGDIRQSIEGACLVVADRGRTLMFFYEVGIAHTIEKPVLLLAQSMSDVPFDLRHRRVLLYEYSPRGCKKLECHFAESVRAMLHRSQTALA